jgi:D-alanine-D-alanine ligase
MGTVELTGAPPRGRPRLPRRVLVAHNPVGVRDDPSTSDVLAQVELVEQALAELGVPATRLAVTGWRVWEELAAAVPGPGTLVFNLVEAPPGLPAVHPATAAVLELAGLPFSGSSAACLWLTTDKLATRAVLAAQGLPVAPGGRLDRDDVGALDRVPPPWILKPSCEDASLGLDGAAVCATREAALARARELLRRFPGRPLVVESFLPGRELNVSLLGAGPGGGAVALPVAEIAFVDFPPGMPRIVGYEAKWQPESFAYTHTVRQFPHGAEAAPLLDQVQRLALAAWRACGLAGYGRVDFRLDAQGAPHILEVNANPCLAADAGFIAAAEQAGLAPAAVVAGILTAALERHRASGLPRRPAASATTAAGSTAGRKPARLRAAG